MTNVIVINDVSWLKERLKSFINATKSSGGKFTAIAWVIYPKKHEKMVNLYCECFIAAPYCKTKARASRALDYDSILKIRMQPLG